MQGLCADLANPAKATKGPEYFMRDSNDALATVKVLKTMPDIDGKHIFLHGHSFGAIGTFDVRNDCPGVIVFFRAPQAHGWCVAAVKLHPRYEPQAAINGFLAQTDNARTFNSDHQSRRHQ